MKLLLSWSLASDSNCIDIGAAEGILLSEFVRLAPQGSHIAYEAIPDVASALTERFPGVLVRGVAVAAAAGVEQFAHVTNASGWSGLREYGFQMDAAPELEQLTVETVALDDDLPDGYVPSLIKIDVNGAEGLVFEGARRTLEVHKPVVLFECGLGAAAYGTTLEQIHDQLSSCGLRIFTLDGLGPLTVDAFLRASADGRWNWVAHA